MSSPALKGWLERRTLSAKVSSSTDPRASEHWHDRLVDISEISADARPLLAPEHLTSRSEALARPSPIPAVPGVYAWYFRDPPPKVPLAGCHAADGAHLLYVGISPGKPPSNGRPPSRQNLRTRVRYHYRGNAYGSTLRLTLGCLLGHSLGLRLQTVSLSGRMTFAAGEDRLSAWMSEHAYVTWMPYNSPWLLEDRLIEEVSLPLNLRGNEAHAFHPALTDLRRAAREEALRSRPAEG